MKADDRQMRMIRAARRIEDPMKLLVQLDMAALLMDAGYPMDAVAECLDLEIQGNVSKLERLREALRIERLWPEDLRFEARQHGASWSVLYEAAMAWENKRVERETVVGYVRHMLKTEMRWPDVNEMRKVCGYRPTTVPESERLAEAGQETMFPGGQ